MVTPDCLTANYYSVASVWDGAERNHVDLFGFNLCGLRLSPLLLLWYHELRWGLTVLHDQITLV